jgi:hypothetical protein
MGIAGYVPMFRFLAVLCLFGSLSACVSSQEKAIKSDKASPSQQSETTKSLPSVSVTCDCGAANGPAKRADQSDPPINWTLIVSSATAILSLIAAFIVWQQVKGLRGAERPWLLPVFADYQWEDSGRNGPPIDVPLCVIWRMKNYGRTPAKITKVEGGAVFVETLSEIRKDAPYGKAVFFAEEPILPPGEETTPMKFTVERILSLEELQAFSDNKMFLVLFGRIKYQSVFGKKHISRFCYGYQQGHPDISGFHIKCGDKSMNHYT